MVATDENGNKSTVSASTSPVSNFGRGVPVVSPTAPTDFKADGDLSEWSNVVPFVVGTTENSYGLQMLQLLAVVLVHSMMQMILVENFILQWMTACFIWLQTLLIML